MQYVGTFWNLLSPYTLVVGLTTLLLFTFHGALYLTLKTGGELLERARWTASRVGAFTVPALFLLVIMSYNQTGIFTKAGAGTVFWGAVAALLLACWLLRSGKYTCAFVMNGLTIIFTTVAIFWGLFPGLWFPASTRRGALTSIMPHRVPIR